MATILEFIQPAKSEFDDETTRVMGEAFDAACTELHDNKLSAVVKEIIAGRIIEAAKKGERDPVRLRNAALVAFGYGKEAS